MMDAESKTDIVGQLNQEAICKFWETNSIFLKSIEKNKENPSFIHFDGPPFATGNPHYGHIAAGFIKDTITRFYQDNGVAGGHNVPRKNGFDTHGLPIEFEIEKLLGIKTKDEIDRYGIGKYNEACRDIVLRCADDWKIIMGKLGRWIDFDDGYKTMDLSFMNSTWWVFKQLYEKNRIYSGVRIMPYSTACGTPLSNFETQQNYQEVQDDSLFIKLPLVLKFQEQDAYLMVWTTTPWTLPSNYALCVNPAIEYCLVKYKDVYYICAGNLIDKVFKEPVTKISSFAGSELLGLEYVPAFTYNTQMTGIPYKILGDSYVTDKDGTGIVHIAPSYGMDDHRVCIEQGLITKESKLFQPLDANGFVTADIPEFAGMFYKNYKDKTKQDLNTGVVIMLKEKGFYFEKRQITHNYPFCWRSDTPLIYRSVSSWFVKVEDMQERMVELNKQINWIPGHVGESRFGNWLAHAKDWGISRSRFWGTPIPIWESEDGDIICVGSSYELEELAGLESGSIKDLHRHFVDQIVIKKDGKEYKRTEFVLDCWFESGSMPYASLSQVGIVELLRNSETGIEKVDGRPCIRTTDGKTHYILPADFIAEGLDQTRGWFYTLMVISASLFDIIPFKNVIVNGLVLAEDGKKMSKRLKNYPDPMDIVKEYGSDCLRLYLLGSQIVRAEALKFSKIGVHNMMREIIIPYKNTFVFFKEYLNLYLKENNANPLYAPSMETVTNPLNVWIICQYSLLRHEYYYSMYQYDLKSAVAVLSALVNVLNNGYIKLGRNLLKGKEGVELWSESLSTMYYILKYFISDFKALIPYFCEMQYLELKRIQNIPYFSSTEHSGMTKVVREEFISDDFFEPLSIHLNNQLGEFTYMSIPEEKEKCATDFDIMYKIIGTIHQLRGSINLSAKKPLRSVGIVVDDTFDSEYSTRYKEYLSFVSDECNVLEIRLLNHSMLDVKKTIVLNKGLIFKRHGKSVAQAYEELSAMSSEQLDVFMKKSYYKEFELEPGFFNVSYSITLKDSLETNAEYILKEISYGTNKITILADKYYDENIDKLYFYRLVATRVQRARKNAGLHPWDSIKCYYSGTPKYSLEDPIAQQVIQSITKYNLLQYLDEPVFFKQPFEEVELTICLQKI
jgi:isoleucyl-tRNA synthetase